MSFILNEFDIDTAQRKAAQDHHRPNIQAATLSIARLMEWTNDNSDGWAYWSAPLKASVKLQQIVHDWYLGRAIDAPQEDVPIIRLRAAYTPIKAFLTRQGVQHEVIFPNDLP